MPKDTLRDFCKEWFDIDFETTELFRILQRLELSGKLRGGVYLAGGAIRRMLIGQPQDSDLDFFFADKESENSLRDHLNSLTSVSVLCERTGDFVETYTILDPETIACKVKIQLIFGEHYRTPEDLIDSFDFTICQFVTDLDWIKYESVSVADLKARQLEPCGITRAVSSLKRLIKYHQQGFTMSNAAIKRFLEQVANIDLDGDDQEELDPL